MGVFHEGEIEVQRATGGRGLAERLQQAIKREIPARAVAFLSAQTVLLLGIANADDMPYVVPLFGSPGFIRVEGARTIFVDLTAGGAMPDAWCLGLLASKSVGGLVIDLSNRRRIRINGVIRDFDGSGLRIDLQQFYVNCPKYIRRWESTRIPESYRFDVESAGTRLDRDLESLIAAADTAFVASIGPDGADVSHRGGSRGFIRTEVSRNRLVVPDYQGNGMFNTLGNFRVNPRAGVMIANFASGLFLQLSGAVDITLGKEPEKLNTGGTGRYWELAVTHWKLYRLHAGFDWVGLDYSPFNP